jgi:hypothetical protein
MQGRLLRWVSGGLRESDSREAERLSILAAKLAHDSKHAEAEKLAARSVAILRARRASALRGGFAPDTALARARAYLNHGEHASSVLERYVQISSTLAQHGDASEALRSRAFMAAQDLMGSAPARSMAMAAVRRAAGTSALAKLMREQQTLTVQVLDHERRMHDASAVGDLAAAAALQLTLHQKTQRLAAMNRRLHRDFPNYPDFISPLPLTIAQVQATLGPDEGLLFLLPSRQDLHVFAVGPDTSAWQRIKNGVAATEHRAQRYKRQQMAEGIWRLPAPSIADHVPDKRLVAPVPVVAARLCGCWNLPFARTVVSRDASTVSGT